MHAYEYLFEQFANPLRHSNFKEKKNGKSQYNSSYVSNEIVCKVKTRSHPKSKRILEYSITLFDKAKDPLIHLNYLADCVPFVPESVKYYEPTWEDFTDVQLVKAIKYLTPLLNLFGQMRMKPDRNLYKMLIFKDHFYLAIRVKNEFNELEHNLCIKAYNCSLN